MCSTSSPSSEAPSDVVLGTPVVGLGEDLGRLVRPDKSAHRSGWRNDRMTKSSSSLVFHIPFNLRPAAALSRTDMVGNGFGRWNTIPNERRTATGSTFFF